MPEFVEFTEEPLPRNPAGKLLKNALRGRGAVPFDTTQRKPQPARLRSRWSVLLASAAADFGDLFISQRFRLQAFDSRGTLSSDGRGSRCKETEVPVPPPK